MVHKYAAIARLKLYLGKALVGLIALMVLNCSVDTAYDPVALKWNGKEYKEDPAFNDIESIYELVTECWMEMDNFVPEQEDTDGYEIGKTLKDWVCGAPVLLLVNTPFYSKHFTEHLLPDYPLVSIEISIPPPDHLG